VGSGVSGATHEAFLEWTSHHTPSQAYTWPFINGQKLLSFTLSNMGFYNIRNSIVFSLTRSYPDSLILLLLLLGQPPRLVSFSKRRYLPLIHVHELIPFNAFIIIVSTVLELFLHSFAISASLSIFLNSHCSSLSECVVVPCFFAFLVFDILNDGLPSHVPLGL